MELGGTNKDIVWKQRVRIVKKTQELVAQAATAMGKGHLYLESPPDDNAQICQLNTWRKNSRHPLQATAQKTKFPAPKESSDHIFL